jgi:hypothetical protein
LSLDKGKLINKEWNDIYLNMMIYNCINIENNIQYINELNQNIIKFNSYNNITKELIHKEEDINEILEKVKNIGKINTQTFKFKTCLLNIDENRKFDYINLSDNSQEFIEAYKKRELPFDYYREFNSQSAFMYYAADGSKVFLDEIDESVIDTIDISWNYINIILPLARLLI